VEKARETQVGGRQKSGQSDLVYMRLRLRRDTVSLRMGGKSRSESVPSGNAVYMPHTDSAEVPPPSLAYAILGVPMPG